MSISLDPYTIIKDLAGRQEKKSADKLLNKYYHIRIESENLVGKLLGLDKIGQDLILTVESGEKQMRIPFKSVETFMEVKSEEYEFPRKLDELLSISKSREEKRPSYLSWLLSSARSIRDSAIKWFDEEASQVERQLDILVFLFKHRNYQDWKSEASQIREKFNKAIGELDQILKLVQEGKATKITHSPIQNSVF
jgi:hypothetical protein